MKLEIEVLAVTRNADLSLTVHGKARDDSSPVKLHVEKPVAAGNIEAGRSYTLAIEPA